MNVPYGETWIQENGTGEEGKHSPKYNSQELDKETGYYFYNARHYDPEIARFVTADTVVDGEGTTKGWNRYMYVGGNPIQYKDPTGHRGTSNNGGTHGQHPASKSSSLMSSAWNSVKSFFGGGKSVKGNAESKLSKNKGSSSRFQVGDISPSGNGVIKKILNYNGNGHKGSVYITGSNKKPNTSFWQQFDGKLRHWYKEKINPKTQKPILSKADSLKMFDISNKKRGGASDYYGPNKDFKVSRAGLSDGYGGRIDILMDGKKVPLGHFTEINEEVYKAAKTGKSLSSGTYLGETKGLIGSSSGPHVHGQSSQHRDETLKSFINKK